MPKLTWDTLPRDASGHPLDLMPNPRRTHYGIPVEDVEFRTEVDPFDGKRKEFVYCRLCGERILGSGHHSPEVAAKDARLRGGRAFRYRNARLDRAIEMNERRAERERIALDKPTGKIIKSHEYDREDYEGPRRTKLRRLMGLTGRERTALDKTTGKLGKRGRSHRQVWWPGF